MGFGNASSGWEGGRHVATVGGPGGGGSDGGFRGGRGGGRGMDMYNAMMPMMEEAFETRMRGARTKEKSAKYDLKERKRSDRAARAPLMAARKLKPTPVDPMRYANKHRQAARNAQFSQGGYGTYGQGRMSMDQKGDAAAAEAAAAYPSYFQSMMASGMM